MESQKIYELKSLLANKKASYDFKYFVAQTFKDYSFNWHHEYLIDKLNSFAKGEIKKLMVFMPPQHGKSELVSRRFPAFLFGVNPDLSIVGSSYSIDLARKFNRAIQRIITSKEYYDIFPNTSLNSKRTVTTESYLRNSEEFEIVGHKGFYKSVGVMGGLTGNKIDIGIIDDPVKDRIEASSETYRNRVWDWYSDVFSTRLHNDSQVLFTMTRWNEDDLAGRILEKEDDWHIITFPAIKETIENQNDPREIGEALWPQRHELSKIESIRKNNTRTFASLYQQRPAPQDGNIVKVDWFQYFDKNNLKPNPSNLYMYIDSAYTSDKGNDPTAIMIYEVKGDSAYIWHCMEYWLEFPELIKKIEELSMIYFKSTKCKIWIEGKASGKTIVQYLKAKTNHLIREDKIPSNSKVERMNAATFTIEAGKIFIPTNSNWLEKFLDQVKKFPNAKHDDMCDCLSAVCRLISKPKISARYA